MYNHQIGNHVQLMILDLTYILHFKVTCDNEGQTYTNHALSPTNLILYIMVECFILSAHYHETRRHYWL